MPYLTVDIALSRDQYLELYRSYVRQVQARARNGQSVRFPVGVLVPFVTASGVHGTFRLHFDDAYRYQGIERLDNLPAASVPR